MINVITIKFQENVCAFLLQSLTEQNGTPSHTVDTLLLIFKPHFHDRVIWNH